MTITAWLALFVAVYSAFATFVFAPGGLAGGFGVWFSIWVLTQHPGIGTRLVAVPALVVNALAFAAALLILVLVIAGEA